MMEQVDPYTNERARERGFSRALPGSEPYTGAAETEMLERDYLDPRASRVDVKVVEVDVDVSKLVKYLDTVISDILEMRNAELSDEIKQLGVKIEQMGTERNPNTSHGTEKHTDVRHHVGEAGTSDAGSRLPLFLTIGITISLIGASLIGLPQPYNFIASLAIAGPLSASILGLRKRS